jgi:two-component system sensor histidine kinase/response regulator
MGNRSGVEAGREQHRVRLWLRLARHLPWLVLALSLLVTYELWQDARHTAVQALRTEFDFRVRDAADRLSRRMAYYEQLLHGARAFVVSRRQVEGGELHEYIASLGLEKNFPGVNAVSFAPLLRPAHQQKRSAKIGVLATDFDASATVDTESAPIALVEPPSPENRLALGVNQLDNPHRRADMELARDMDRAVISQEEGEKDQRQAAFQMFLPVYAAGAARGSLGERRSNLAGWLAASFRMNELLAGVLGERVHELDVELYDGDQAATPSMVYDSDRRANPSWSPLFTASRFVEIAGHRWLMEAHSLPGFEARIDPFKTQATAVIGGVLSALLTLLTWLLVRDRARALRTAALVEQELEERKAMQVTLERNEQLWRLALEGSGDAVWEWDPLRARVSLSKRSADLMGYGPTETIHESASVATRVHPDDLLGMTVAMRAFLDGNAPAYNHECRVRRADGGWQWVMARGTVAERDAHGKPTRVVGTLADIDQRKKAELALQLSEAKLQTILDNAPVGIWLVGVDGRYHFVNKTFRNAVGAPERAFLEAGHLSDILGQDAAEKCIESDRAALAQDGPHVAYETLNFVDGKAHQLEVRKLKLHDHAGETVGVIGISVDITEQREREKALRESETKYRALVESAQSMIVRWSPQGNVVYVNPYAEEFFGYSKGELVGRHVIGTIVPETESTSRDLSGMIEDILANPEKYRLNVNENIKKNGERVWVLWTNRSILDESGNIVEVLSVGSDLSERMQAEEALRESEENYRRIFDNADDFIFTVDSSFRFTSATRIFCQAMGYTQEEAIGAHIGKFLTADSVKKAQEMTARKLRGECTVTQYEVDAVRRDGSIIPLELKTNLIQKNGRMVGVQGIARDVAERRRYELALREGEEKYRALFENVGDFAYATDLEGNFTAASDTLLQVTGFARDELVNAPISKLLGPEDLALAQRMTAAKLAGEKQVTRYELNIRSKDGHAIPMELVSSLTYKDGVPVGVQGIGRDITERLEREAALLAANAKAEAASRAKGEFLANMSHEIRTPMNSVIGMARLALARETDARQSDYLEKILLSGEHLLGLIDDILDFSKLDAGKLKMEAVDFDLFELMQSLNSLMAGKAAAGGLHLALETDPELPRNLQGDPLRLRQVLLNFIDNAIKFTKQGSVRVRAKALGQAAEGACEVLFEVQDTGIGMSQVELSTLFQPFHQADGSVTRRYGGTGLGLAISKRLIEMMGGEVGVVSAENCGSTFWFRVQLTLGNQTTAPSVAGAGARPGNHHALKAARILLAENNQFNQQVAREFLEAAGCVVQVANDGAEALDLLARQPFDCVLMDIQMPVMDGLQATRRIRANPALAAIPIIAMTANALAEERANCLAAGMDDFIAKPVLPEVMYAVIGNRLSNRSPFGEMSSGREKDVRSSQTAVIDLRGLAEMVGNDERRLREFVSRFAATTRQDMARVDAALTSHNATALKELGHHMKSPAGMVGALGFAALCQALEDNADNPPKAGEIAREMHAELALIEARLASGLPGALL